VQEIMAAGNWTAVYQAAGNKVVANYAVSQPSSDQAAGLKSTRQ
jgi:hypothetical protein